LGTAEAQRAQRKPKGHKLKGKNNRNNCNAKIKRAFLFFSYLSVLCVFAVRNEYAAVRG
jgi:hypothetical protein